MRRDAGLRSAAEGGLAGCDDFSPEAISTARARAEACALGAQSAVKRAKTGLSSLALKRQLGVSYPTAWALHHKINHAMAAREACHQLSGAVQVDDAYLGGEHPGGKPGRGSKNKTPFVAAVSLDAKGRPALLKLHRLAASRWSRWVAGPRLTWRLARA